MPRKTIKKPLQKSPKPSRQRSEANRPPNSSSSSDPSLTSIQAEREAARQERARSKSKSKAEAAAAAAAAAAPPQPLPQMPGVSHEQAGISFERPDSPRSPPRFISPKRKTRTSRSPFKTKSPLATAATPTAAETPPAKKKYSKVARTPSSNLLAEGRPGSYSGSFSRLIPFDAHIERIKHFASITPPRTSGASTSQIAPRDRKAFVFVPDVERISQSTLGQLMSQLYGYLGTVMEEGAQMRRLPSVDEQSSSEDSLRIRVLDVRRQPILEEVRAERDAEREAEREAAAARQAAEQVTETLVRVLSNLSAPSSSPEPKRKTPPPKAPKAPKGAFQYNPDLTKRRHSIDGGSVCAPTQGGSSHVAPDIGKGKQRFKFTLKRIPESRHRHTMQDTDPGSGSQIQMIELRPIQDSSLARRRLSRTDDPSAELEKAGPSQTAQEASRGEQDMGPPSKPARLAADSPQPGFSGYREPRVSVESDESQTKGIEDGASVERDREDTPPRSHAHLSQVFGGSVPRIRGRSGYESSLTTSTGEWSGSIPGVSSDPTPPPIHGSCSLVRDESLEEEVSIPEAYFMPGNGNIPRARPVPEADPAPEAEADPVHGANPVPEAGPPPRATPTPDILTCDWRQCYQEFIELFDRQSATVTEFFQHLSTTLMRRIREPGSAARRYFLVAGLSVWVLVQDAANDYWFFCGGRNEENNTDGRPRMLGPDRSVEYMLGEAPEQPPRRRTVQDICSEAMDRVTRGARRRRASSREPEPTPEEREANIQRLLAIIKAGTPVGPVEPRRDFTAADCPFITLSFQDDTPENLATDEATGEAAGAEAAGEDTGAAGDEPEASGSKLKVPAREDRPDDESRPR